jgi:hypothetical protein
MAEKKEDGGVTERKQAFASSPPWIRRSTRTERGGGGWRDNLQFIINIPTTSRLVPRRTPPYPRRRASRKQTFAR